jgi:HEAT repeat protein
MRNKESISRLFEVLRFALILLLVHVSGLACATTSRALVSRLVAEDAYTRIAACDALILQKEKAIPALMDDWFNGPYQQELILRAIGSAAVVPLLEQLQSTDDADREFAALEAIAMIGPEARSAISTVLTEIGNPDNGIAAEACRALMRIGSRSEAAKSKLLTVLAGFTSSRDQPMVCDIKAEMIMALGNVAPLGDRDVIQTASAMMEPTAEPVYMPSAAYTLFRMGYHSQEMFDFLKSLAGNDSAEYSARDRAIKAIAWIGDAQSIEVLNTLYEGSDDGFAIVKSLYDAGPRPEALQVFSRALLSSNRSVQFVAIVAVTMLGPAAQEALPSMQSLRDGTGPSKVDQANASFLEEAIIRISREAR